MAKSTNIDKPARIKKAVVELRKLLKDIAKDRMQAAEGVVQRVAFMQVTLEDLEADINEHGTVESFSQTENIAYDRERPAVRIYNATIRNYSAVCKQLFDLLPDDKPKVEKDELMNFIKRVK